MKLKFYFFIYFLIVVVIDDAAISTGHYTVIAPGTIHSGYPYNVAVTVYNFTEICAMEIIVESKNFHVMKNVTLDRIKSTDLVSFKMPLLESDDYNLTVHGLSGLIFTNTTRLIFKDLQIHVRIQTTKGLYKPGEIVDFRVFYLDVNLKPVKPQKTAIVWCNDAQGNRIKTFENLKVSKGIFTGQLSIASFVNLGRWTLCASYGLNMSEKCVYFKVDDIVNPTFVAQVIAPEKASLRNGKVKIIIHAYYINGGPIQGIAYLEVNSYYEGNIKTSPDQPKDQPIILDLVNGKVLYDLDLKPYRSDYDYLHVTKNLLLNVTVIELFTDLQQKITTHIELYPYSYLVTCKHPKKQCHIYYVNNKNESNVYTFHIQHLNGSEIEAPNALVNLIYTPAVLKINDNINFGTMKPTSPSIIFSSLLSDKGYASFIIHLSPLPSGNFTSYYQTELEIAGERQLLFGTRFKRLLSHSRINRRSKAAKPLWQISRDRKFLHLTFKVPYPSSEFALTLMGRGNIIHSYHITYKTETHHVDLKNITITSTMMPSTNLILTWMDDQNYLHHYESNFNIKTSFINKLSIETPKQVVPGSNINFLIKTRPNSFVGLMAVDKRALLTRGNNDLTPNDLDWLLLQYQSITPWQEGFSSYPGERSGLITLTNANYVYNRYSRFYENPNIVAKSDDVDNENERYTDFDSDADFDIRERSRENYPWNLLSDERIDNKWTPDIDLNLRVRQNFPDIWFFDQITDVNDNITSLSKRIPDAITSWEISAFAIHEKYGLVVLPQNINIMSTKLLFVMVNLPSSIKREEILQIPVTVFNRHAKALDITVTLKFNSLGFQSMEKSENIHQIEILKKKTRVRASDTSTVDFALKAKQVGEFELKFQATSEEYTDTELHRLKVKSEGYTEYKSKLVFLQLNTTNERLSERIQIDLPQNYIRDSLNIQVTFIQNLIDPIMKSFQAFANEPSGISERIISMMLSNYFIYNYLNATKQVTPYWHSKLIGNLEKGYQNLLRYRLADGSFSYFHSQQDQIGVLWLTTYVLRTLKILSGLLDIENDLLLNGYTFLLANQNADGSFTETKKSLNSYKLNKIDLTAYVLLTLTEGHDICLDQLCSEINKTFSFLEKQNEYHNATDLTNALLCYAKSNGNISSDPCLDSVKDLKAFFNKDFSKFDLLSSTAKDSSSYMIVTLLQDKFALKQKGSLIWSLLHWLILQGQLFNDDVTTVKSAIELGALLKFHKQLRHKFINMTLNLYSNNFDEAQIIRLSPELQKEILLLPANTGDLQIDGFGTGNVLLHLFYSFNVKKDPNYSLSLNDKNATQFKLEMKPCVQDDPIYRSPLLVVKIALPSGFKINHDSLEDLRSIKGVKHVEANLQDTLIVVYITHLSRWMDTICLPITAYRSYAVESQQPSLVIIYDYYNTTRQKTMLYDIEDKILRI